MKTSIFLYSNRILNSGLLLHLQIVDFTDHHCKMRLGGLPRSILCLYGIKFPDDTTHTAHISIIYKERSQSEWWYPYGSAHREYEMGAIVETENPRSKSLTRKREVREGDRQKCSKRIMNKWQIFQFLVTNYSH